MRETLNKRNAAVVSDRLYRAVRNVIQEAQGVVSRVANWAMVEANWRVGVRNALRSELSWTHYRSLHQEERQNQTT